MRGGEGKRGEGKGKGGDGRGRRMLRQCLVTCKKEFNYITWNRHGLGMWVSGEISDILQTIHQH